jgi:small-conductance mechanosensitive channel
MNDTFDFILVTILDPNTIHGKIVLALIILGLALIGMRLVRAWSRRFSEHPALFVDKTSAQFVGQLLQIAVFLIAAMVYAHLITSLQQLGMAMLASASVLSIIIGLAAQSTLGNLVAGIALLFYRPFGIGDVLTVNALNGKETGTVQEFSLGYTRLLAEDGRLIIAPNSIVISSVLVRIKQA